MDPSVNPMGKIDFGKTGAERYSNPFYNIPSTHTPNSMDGMLWWSQHLMLKNGFFRAVIERISAYFVTSFTLECDDKKIEEEITEALEFLDWKSHLREVGLNYLAYGNSFSTFNPGFSRSLRCPKCNKFHAIDKVQFDFNKFQFISACQRPECGYKGVMPIVDTPSRNPKDMSIIHWNPRDILTVHEETTNHTDFYWNIPKQYQQRLTGKMKVFYAKHTPEVIIRCVQHKKAMQFKDASFIHLKYPTPASLKTDGRAVPPCMYMFDEFFMYQTLKRYNEVICLEDIAPFRVVSMAEGGGNNPMANPVFNQNGGQWRSEVDKMISNHRKDPGAYHIFPFALNYQQLGGQGRQLAPVDLMDNAKANILGSFNVPQELFNMTLNQQAAGPSLRMFENSWSGMLHAYQQFMQKWVDVICHIRGWNNVKIKMMPATLSDDMERKSAIGQLVAANAISRSELLRTYNLDYEDQIRKKQREDTIQQELQEEEQKKRELSKQQSNDIWTMQQQAQQQGQQQGQPGQIDPASYQPQAGNTPGDVMQQAQEIAQQLMPLDPAGRRAELQKIKPVNPTLWSQVKSTLEEMNSQARSQGLQQAKQGQQPQQ